MRVDSAYFFGPAEAPLFGWLHQDATRPARLGLLVCSPLGHEGANAHRSLRCLAMAAADAGMPSLRFDMAGCGDSADTPGAASMVSAWVASINAAADELRRATGVQRIAVAGLRSGALLGALAAAGRSDAAHFVALAPVVSGRSLLREWKALESTAALRSQRTDGAVEVAGFVYSAATCAELATADINTAPQAPAPHVLIVDRDDLAGSERWAAHLQAHGATVERVALAGFAGMLDEAQRVVVPQHLVAHVCAWLAARNADTLVPCAPAPTAPASTAPALVAPGVREQAVQMAGGGAALFGVLSEPLLASASTGTMLLLNAGAVHHIGVNRLNVELARRLAAQGQRVLRVDLSGIGDSPARAGCTDNTVYSEHAAQDIALALAELRRRAPAAVPRVVGLCSGAYHGLKAAVAGAGISQVLVVNPLVFFWKPGMTLDAPLGTVQEHVAVRQAAQYRQAALDPGRWLKLLRGQTDLRRIWGTLAQRGRGFARHRLRGVARRLGWPLSDDLASELLAAAGHGTDLQFIFSAHDPGSQLLRDQGGGTVRRLQRAGKLSIWMMPRADHTFSTSDARQRLYAQVEAVLLPPPASPPLRPYAVSGQHALSDRR